MSFLVFVKFFYFFLLFFSLAQTKKPTARITVQMSTKILPITLPITVLGSKKVLIPNPSNAQKNTAKNPFILIFNIYFYS